MNVPRIALSVALLAMTQACTRLSTSSSSGSAFTVPPDAAVYCGYGFEAEISSEVVACAEKEDAQIVFYDYETAIGLEQNPPVDVLPLDGYELTEMVSNPFFEEGDEAPLLYVFVCDQSNGSSWMRMHAAGDLTVQHTPSAELELPAGEFAVAFAHSQPEEWWLSTADAAGTLRFYRLFDFDGDSYPDEILPYADLSVLAEAYPETVGRLAAAPFFLWAGYGENELWLRQLDQDVFRMLDEDEDGFADIAALPGVDVSPGPIIAQGYRAGCQRLHVGAFAEQVEVWTLDADGGLAELIGVGEFAPDAMVTTVVLDAMLIEGQVLAARDPDTDEVGPAVTVLPSTHPVVLVETDSDIEPGGFIDVYIPGTDLFGIQAVWQYHYDEGWPDEGSELLFVTSIEPDLYRISYPDFIDNVHPFGQSTAIHLEDYEESHLMEMRVSHSDSDADAEG